MRCKLHARGAAQCAPNSNIEFSASLGGGGGGVEPDFKQKNAAPTI